MSDYTVKVTGLKELARSFHRVTGELGSELDTALLEAAELTAVEAHRLIRAQRLVGGERSTGRLDRLTKPFLRRRTGVAGVRSTATNDGFPYPWMYEFVRERAFLYPALERTRPAVIGRLDRMLDQLAGVFDH